jgi:hypothetical protein
MFWLRGLKRTTENTEHTEHTEMDLLSFFRVFRVIRGFLFLFLTLFLFSTSARAQNVIGDLSYTKQTFFRIPFQTDPSERRLKQVQLYYSTDQGQSWHPYNSVAPDQRFFDFQASADGVYWFAVRTVDMDGRGNPLNMQGARPGLKVCVDTQPPTIRLRALQARDGEVGVEWDVRDDNLDVTGLRLEYRLPAVAEWAPLAGELAASGQRYWKPAAPGAVEVRLRARDRADNWSEEKTTLSPGSFTSQQLDGRQHPTDPPAPVRQDGINLVNSKRISLNYELKEVGPSKVSLVELWVTRDGRTWQKFKEDTGNGQTSPQPPFIVEVSDEGQYGFTLIARSGVGLGERPPQVGDAPQVWVEVDLTKPVVRIQNIDPPRSVEDRNLTITWSASDKNLGRQPITISYSELAEGPWTPIAANLENNGRYVWPMPLNLPFRIFVKVEAADRAGNIGSAQTANPILVDLSKPKVNITTIEPRQQ